MSADAQAQGAQAAQATAEAAADGKSLLDAVIVETPKVVARDKMKGLMAELVDQALKGTVVFKGDVSRTLAAAIKAIDQTLSEQLAAVMHHPDFQKLEGTWRGFHYLVHNSETSTQLKIKVLNVSKRDLQKDLEKAAEFDQSQLFKKLYENEFGQAGGEPHGALIGDYEFDNHPDDIEMLSKISGVAASAFCPFIAAPAPSLLGLESWKDLNRPRDIAKIFDSAEYAKWRSFRDSEDSRFVTLTMPRVLSRLPYGKKTTPIDEFAFEEVVSDQRGDHVEVAHENYCWMNAAWALGARLTDASAKYGWCTAIRGVENGGKVENLPTHIVRSEDGDLEMKCPTEVLIPHRRDAEFSGQGFMALCHFKNTDYSVFFGAQTCQKPRKYNKPEATANAAISARLPYIMATSRIAHFLKVIATDKIGSFMERSDCEDFLKNWIADYVLDDPKAKPELKARYPLAAAEIEVKEVPGAPGSYQAVAWLQPWLQLEELTTSLRLVASIPKKAG